MEGSIKWLRRLRESKDTTLKERDRGVLVVEMVKK